MAHKPSNASGEWTEPAGRAPASERHRVLVVDDDETVRKLVPRLLAMAGVPCECEVAEDGLLGLLHLVIFRPHLVILDLDMPRLDGAEFCEWLKRDGIARPQVLVMTGDESDPRLQRALNAGAGNWLPKSAGAEELLDKVTGMLSPRPAPTMLDGLPHTFHAEAGAQKEATA